MLLYVATAAAAAGHANRAPTPMAAVSAVIAPADADAVDVMRGVDLGGYIRK
jgi:hypothetical protein